MEHPGLFEYLAAHPHEAGLFNAAMISKAHCDIAALLAAYDIAGLATMGDIGGGGHLLRPVLRMTCS
jgi:hypothetical protein